MDPTCGRLLHEYGHTDTQRSTPLLEHTTLPKKLINILICYFLVVGGQIDGEDLEVGVDFSKTNYHFLPVSNLAPVVQTLDSAIQRINHYPADNAIVSRNTYPLDSDLSGG